MSGSRLQEAKAWLDKAANDLRGARIDMQAAPSLIEDALFHCQQAAEKAMKAFLTAHDVPFRRVHDLDELAIDCERIDSSLAQVLVPARDLTVFAWEFRYPGSGQTPSEAEANAARATAEATVSAVRARLGP